LFHRLRSNQSGSNVRAQNAQGMGIKSDDHCLAAAGAGALNHLLQNVLMPEVDAVKIAHADHGRAETSGDFLKRAEDPQTVTSRCSSGLALIARIAIIAVIAKIDKPRKDNLGFLIFDL